MFKFNLDDEKVLKNPLQFEYINWKGNKGIRTVVPIEVYYGQNDFHKGNQWLLKAYDIDKKAERHFAIKDIIRFIDNKEDYFKMPYDKESFIKMRSLTPEEKEELSKNLKDMYKSTGINLFDDLPPRKNIKVKGILKNVYISDNKID